MSDPRFDIRYVAELARLALSPEEEETIGAQLSHVIQYFNQLKELDVEGLDPMAHAVPLTNVTREDVVRPSLPHSEALRNAPASANGLFMVPKIVE